MSFLIKTKVDIYFGNDSIKHIATYLKDYRRVLVVTGEKSAKVSGALDKFLDSIKDLNLEYYIFNKVTPNPIVSIVREGVRVANEFRPDAIIGIGGGSSLDTAKAIAVSYANNVDVWKIMKEEIKVSRIVPIFAINTTHGTGSEADRYFVITNTETKEKLGYGLPITYPKASFDDPTTTLTLPKIQTVSTTFDAFYHALESSTSKDSSPFTFLLSTESIKLISKYLPIVYKDSKNYEARYWLMYAALLAGISIDHGRTHIIHAMEHPLSGVKDIPHGVGLAVLGPYCIKYFWESKKEILSKLLSLLIGVKPTHSSTEVSKLLQKYQQQYDIPVSLSELGFGPDDIDLLTDLAFKVGSHLFNLAPINVTKDLIKRIYKEAM